jgi:hypothetical protein
MSALERKADIHDVSPNASFSPHSGHVEPGGYVIEMWCRAHSRQCGVRAMLHELRAHVLFPTLNHDLLRKTTIRIARHQHLMF